MQNIFQLIKRNGFDFIGLNETVENDMQPFQCGLMPIKKRLESQNGYFKIFIDNYGLHIHYGFFTGNKLTEISAIFTRFHNCKNFKLIKNALNYLACINFNKINSSNMLETILNIDN